MFKGTSRGWLASFVSTWPLSLSVLIVVMFELKQSISHVSACPSQVSRLVGYYSGSKYKEEAYYQPACPFPRASQLDILYLKSRVLRVTAPHYPRFQVQHILPIGGQDFPSFSFLYFLFAVKWSSCLFLIFPS